MTLYSVFYKTILDPRGCLNLYETVNYEQNILYNASFSTKK